MKSLTVRWSTNFAYAIGLITTDGCLSKDGRHIILVSKDIDQLKNYAECLKLKTYKISPHSSTYNPNGKYFRIQISHARLYRFLLKIGLTPNKSKTLSELNIPDRYFRDFLRGHLDGDGSIFTYLDTYNHYKDRTYINQRIYLQFISASCDHIIWLQNRIAILAQVCGALINHYRHKNRECLMWEVRFAKKETIKLLRWIYYKDNLICLSRKYSIVQNIFQMYPA